MLSTAPTPNGGLPSSHFGDSSLLALKRLSYFVAYMYIRLHETSGEEASCLSSGQDCRAGIYQSCKRDTAICATTRTLSTWHRSPESLLLQTYTQLADAYAGHFCPHCGGPGKLQAKSGDIYTLPRSQPLFCQNEAMISSKPHTVLPPRSGCMCMC